MNETDALFPATVVKVLDDYMVVINRGSDHGVKKGDSFLVYFVEPDELVDPTTGEALGRLEIVRGSGSATHVQPKLSTLRTKGTSSSRVVRRPSSYASLASMFGETVEQQEAKLVPFEEPSVGDLAKPI